MNDTSTVARINAQCYRLSSHLSVHRDKYERPPLYMVDTEHEPPSAAISPTNVPAEQTDVAGRDDEALIEPISVRDDASCVQVAVRVRPLITLEGDDESCVQVLHQSVGASHATAIQVGGPSGPRFTFDQVFGVKSTQQYVYETRVAPLIVSCLEGYNATILAYGQTGSGKTHTIMGPDPTVAAASPDDSDLGVIPRAFRAIFDALGEKKESQRQMGVDLEYQVSVQFLELYGEEIRDLLTTHRNSSGSSEKLYIRDLGTDEPEVVGATQTPVSSALEALRCLAHGMLRRVTGATAMNESSSRSHAILTVCIEQSSVVVDSKPMSASTSSAEGSDDCDINEDHIQMTRSKFNFVDLAGAERQKRTGATGKRLQEGIDINKGLSNLGNVISALGDPKKRGKTHVPYRDAKLTRLLKGSLGGNHKTMMIACISPAAVNMGESLNCLRYANRAKNIQNKAVVNVDANTRLVQELQGQVKALATDLLRALDGETDGVLFERSVLVSLANGTSGSVPISPTPSKPSREASEVALRLKETENELRKTRDKLRQTQSYQDAAELELHTLRAQNELCDMQIAALTQERNGALVIPETMQTAVLEKMTTYEGEIDRLKKALHEAESKANAENWNLSNCSDDEWLEREKQTLHSDRNRLECIRAMSSEDAETQYHIVCDSEIGDATQNDQDPTEGDEEEDRGMMDSLANKYVKYATEDADDTDFDASLIEAPPLRKRRVRQVAADLEELSQSIAMKEKLIEQIRRNKEREAMMRAFYENKLENLRSELEARENERDQLVRDLELARERNSASQELADQLLEKQGQIETLKTMQRKFKTQTDKVPRNSADAELLAQLKSDVIKMKKRKADMQKELAYEKKHHIKEVTMLNKIVVQKDREINKIQKESNQRAVDAEKAKTVARSRLAELAQLKKALKLYKRGVGLDPVIVGRRQVRTKGHGEGDTARNSEGATIDVDSIRDYFDGIVASVVQKEVQVDKLVKEWEEYFELNTHLKDFLNGDVEPDASDLETLEVQIRYKNDRIRKLARRVHKQDLPTQINELQEVSSQRDTFLFDANFSKLCNDCSSDLVQSTATKVLFGMIVRERRRVAALAKAAASLDERVQSAEKNLTLSESALRSYMDDHRQAIADLEEKQHDHLRTLIEMVNDDSNQAAFTSDDLESNDMALSEVKYQKMLLVLANERVSVLEDQLAEMSSQSAAVEEYATKIDELNELLLSKTQECDGLEQTRRDLRTGLRKIRDEVLRYPNLRSGSALYASVLDLVDGHLHSAANGAEKEIPQEPQLGIDRQKAIRHTMSPRYKMHVELMNSSDSDSESEEYEVVDSAVKHLNHIAIGSTTQSDSGRVDPGPGGRSVFDRLANPKSFTGTQRHGSKRQGIDSSPEVSPSIRSRTDDSHKEPLRTEVPTTYSSLKRPNGVVHHASDSRADGSTSIYGQPAYQSVFDRLGSPSQYTGTQKEKFQDSRIKRDRGMDAADRLAVLTANDDTAPEGNTVGATIQTDYAKLNVFDRLQNTTTQAAAIRQNETMLSESRSDKVMQSGVVAGTEHQQARTSPVSESETNEQAVIEHDGEKRHSMDIAAYVKQNVFDRLQTTTTLATAVRQSETLHQEGRSRSEASAQISPSAANDLCIPSKKPDSKRPLPASNPVSRADYRKQNVFERLNKTTTETFAKKTHRTKGDEVH